LHIREEGIRYSATNMSLFLTSDETFIDKSTNHGRGNNTRTSFSNYILPDFFQDTPFNLALKEVYFDPNFPSLANLDSPHVKTPSEMDVAPWITHLIFNIYTLDFNKFN